MDIKDGIILSCSSYELEKNEIDFFKSINPLGFVLFKRNFKNKLQLKKLIKSLKDVTLNKDLLIFVDQEGGRVQRFDNNQFIVFPSQSVFGKLYKSKKITGLDLAYKSSYLMGFQLNQVGVDVNFSPVCDLLFSGAHQVIGDRSFGKNPKLVFELSKTFCRGFTDAGIIAVPKHFPGHGRSMYDTHLNSSIVKTSYNELKKTDMFPFKVLEKSLMVMLAHIIYSSIDANVATYSREIIDNILRKNFKFKGLIISDDISMKAINEDLPIRVEKCYKAGCDVVLYCKGELKEIKSFYPFVKKIKEEQMLYFSEEKKKIALQRKNINKFKYELIEYGLINDSS